MTSILKTDEIQSQKSASGNNLELASDGDISVTNNLNVGTIKDATGNTTAMQINSSGHVTRNVIPSWCVGRTAGDLNFTNTNEVTLVWNTSSRTSAMFINGGCSLDTSTGVVTVPTAGLYYVGTSVRADLIGSGYFRIKIRKNNVNVDAGDGAYIIDGSPDGTYDTLTTSMIFNVTESDISSNTNTFNVTLNTGTDTGWHVSDVSLFWGYLVG
jgi:hypothetical protein